MANLSTFLKTSLASALVVSSVAAVSQPAEAFIITGGGPFSNVVTFDDTGLGSVDGYSSGYASYSASPGTDGLVVQGTALGGDPAYRAPSGVTSQYLTVGSSSANRPNADVTINFSPTWLATSFGLLWGSIDSYNTISFFRGGSLLRSFNGTEVVAALNALGINAVVDGTNGTPNGDPRSTQYVKFFAEGSGEYFDQVVLASTQAAFESDNHSYEAIPTPALLPGLIGMGVAALRRKQEEASEENA